jgi:tetratricopeptide (TPR) repeat protein
LLWEQKDRHIVPRWRDFRTTLSLGELQDAKERPPIASDDKNAVAHRVQEFEANRDIWHAADLLSSAFVIGDSESAQIARNFILNNASVAPKSLHLFASGNEPQGDYLGNGLSFERDSQQKLIHGIRKRLRSEPRNALLWVELSRLYTVLGDSRRALRAMTTAAKLAPDNRFVVRSAARLFLHEHDAPVALRIVRGASGAKRDPWLLAAEISVASASRAPSLLTKVGLNRNADTNLSPFACTELSGALATAEMENGKTRKARQLFRQSLQRPNENSVAQVEWANRQIGGLEIDKGLLAVPKSFEATANIRLVAGDWDDAIRCGTLWLHDQPFSTGPAAFTSYALSLVDNHDEAISILRQSLITNPKDFVLINNLAFALGSANRLREAFEVLGSIDLTQAANTSAITLAATAGLLSFRAGQSERGREWYQLAISRASAQGIPKYRAMAQLNLAREELLASTAAGFETATRAIDEASKFNDKT